MNCKYLTTGLLAAVFSASCTQQGKTAGSNKDRVYYHDRRTTVGSNIPRSYSDSASSNSQGGMSAADQMQYDQAQRTLSSGVGSAPAGGGGAGR